MKPDKNKDYSQIEKLLLPLGYEIVGNGIFTHPKLPVGIDLSTSSSEGISVMANIAKELIEIGKQQKMQEMRDVLGFSIKSS